MSLMSYDNIFKIFIYAECLECLMANAHCPCECMINTFLDFFVLVDNKRFLEISFSLCLWKMFQNITVTQSVPNQFLSSDKYHLYYIHTPV